MMENAMQERELGASAGVAIGLDIANDMVHSGPVSSS